MSQQNRKVVFRRINGRVVPINAERYGRTAVVGAAANAAIAVGGMSAAVGRGRLAPFRAAGNIAGLATTGYAIHRGIKKDSWGVGFKHWGASMGGGILGAAAGGAAYAIGKKVLK